MRRPDSRAALTDEVARFQAEVQRLALATVRAIISEELDRRLAEREAAQQRADVPVRRLAEREATRQRADVPVPRLAEREATRQRADVPGLPDTAVAPAVVTREQPPDPADVAHKQPPAAPAGPVGSRKRVAWTRESIIAELASWISSGTSIDATFVTRHGPPGLVAATRRVFGRFDAALNIAGLHVSKLYPDGPPAVTGGFRLSALPSSSR